MANNATNNFFVEQDLFCMIPSPDMHSSLFVKHSLKWTMARLTTATSNCQKLCTVVKLFLNEIILVLFCEYIWMCARLFVYVSESSLEFSVDSIILYVWQDMMYILHFPLNFGSKAKMKKGVNKKYLASLLL